MMRVLWLIPARSGSKGIRHKNIRPLGGMPLLAWRIRGAERLGEVWLSTDSQRYAEVGRCYGATVPFIRPSELSSDTASSDDVCVHAVHFAMRRNRTYDVLGLLQPTSPFVSTDSLRRGLQLLTAHPGAHGVIAVRRPGQPAFLTQPEAPTLKELASRIRNRDFRRQALPQEITPCGGFYLVHWNKFLEHPALFTEDSLPFLLEEPEHMDIDTELDFAFAEFLVATGRVQPPSLERGG